MDPRDPRPPETAPRKINLLGFFSILLLPAVLTLLNAAAGKRDADATGYLALYGSAVAGLWCGIILAQRIDGIAGVQVIVRAIFALWLGLGLGFVSYILSFVGCALGAGLANH